MAAPDWFFEHLGWKSATVKTRRLCEELFGAPVGPNLADLGSRPSTQIAGLAYQSLGVPIEKTEVDIDSGGDSSEARRRSMGNALEVALEADLRSALEALDPGRGWFVTRSGKVDQFSQFAHLKRLQELFEADETLKSTVGRDYQVSTDVMVGVPNRGQGEARYALHAAVSSKLTIRSDRVQNIRFEFATLVRNRRGRLPHLVVVTAEPLPSRVISIGRGTGEIDAVYHLLFDEMAEVIAGMWRKDSSMKQQCDAWAELVDTGRVRPYSELAPVLAAS